MAGLTTPIKNIGTGIHTLSILRIKIQSPTPILQKLAISGWAPGIIYTLKCIVLYPFLAVQHGTME
jgi:hypothetical protein